MLEQAIKNAETEIIICKAQGLRMTVYTIRQNIKLVTDNPEEFSEQFINMYPKK